MGYDDQLKPRWQEFDKIILSQYHMGYDDHLKRIWQEYGKKMTG